MIRLLNRKLIIPRGDTGTFSVPVLSDIDLNNCIAFFTIFDNRTQKRLLQKQAEIMNQLITINIQHTDTINLAAGCYYWDIRFWKDPIIIDGVIINGTEVHSYYAAYSLPVCEIKETGDNFIQLDTKPLSSEQINLLSTTITVSENNANRAESAAEHANEVQSRISNTYQNILGNFEATPYASKDYVINDFLFWDQHLYRVIADINIDDELINNVNIQATSLTEIFTYIYKLISTPNGILTFSL